MCSALGRLQDLKRLLQIVRDKFVERVAHCQDDVLMKLDRREQGNCGGDDGTLIFFCPRSQRYNFTEGEEAQRQVPHVRVSEVHSVLHIAHDQIAGGDKDRHEEFRFHRAIQSKDCSERENEDDRADQEKIDKVTVPGSIAGQDGVMELEILADRQLIALHKDIHATGEKNQDNHAEERTEKCGDDELARDGSKLEPAIRDEQNDKRDPDKERIFLG